MNQHFDSSTIGYYDTHSEEYIRGTVDVDMTPNYELFLSHIPQGGCILDAGCGSGRDSKAFGDQGFEIVSIDACKKMVEATTELTGKQAHLITFQELDFRDRFDGIWACGSLLYVPMSELHDVFSRLTRSLKSHGVIYASFKLGCGERNVQGRLFTDMNRERVRSVFNENDTLIELNIWESDDRRPVRCDETVFKTGG